LSERWHSGDAAGIAAFLSEEAGTFVYGKAMMIDAIGKFQVLGTLGKGAHSSIVRIRRNADSRQYALKIVPIGDAEDSKYLQQAGHEFAVARKLDHANLIKIHALEKLKKFGLLGPVREVRLLIEFVNGTTLDKIKLLPMQALVQIFDKVAAGLVHMHRRGVYHADLKPNNIMLSRGGDVKIIDYGLAWIKGEQKNRVQGTPEYMAPEQATKRTVNEQTDIFNLGATMYRLVTSRHLPALIDPSGVSSLVLKGKAYNDKIKPVLECNPETPKPLAALIHRCVAYNPAERPEFASDVYQALEEIVAEHIHSSGEKLEALDLLE
jgi:serine/threonine protein kinase